ncbi:hypothetical protein JRQ81_013346, partial [Phrynocephalus forsythii]
PKLAAWFTGELTELKQVARRAKRRWWKTQIETDKETVKGLWKAYSKAVEATKKSFFSTTIDLTQNCPMQLFRIVKSLLHIDPRMDNTDHSVSRYEEIAQHLAGKIEKIWMLLLIPRACK